MNSCPEILNSWPIIAVALSVGGVLGCLIGASWATRKAERMIRGGRRPIR